jgi:hypothetical protein
MAVESTSDAIQRLRLEARTIIGDLARETALKDADRRAPSLKAQLAHLDDLSAELRRIAAKAATPDMQRDAETLAALVDEARRHFENLCA